MPEFQAAEKGLERVQRKIGLVIAAQSKGIAPSQGELSDPSEYSQTQQQERPDKSQDPGFFPHGGHSRFRSVVDPVENRNDQLPDQPGTRDQE